MGNRNTFVNIFKNSPAFSGVCFKSIQKPYTGTLINCCYWYECLPSSHAVHLSNRHMEPFYIYLQVFTGICEFRRAASVYARSFFIFQFRSKSYLFCCVYHSTEILIISYLYCCTVSVVPVVSLILLPERFSDSYFFLTCISCRMIMWAVGFFL